MLSLPPSLTVAMWTSLSSTSTSASVSIWPEVTSPGWSDAQVEGLRAFAVHLERNLLQVEDDVGGVFDHAGDRTEFVQHAFDADGGDGRALDGAEQHATQALPMVVPKPRSKGCALNLPNFSVSVSVLDCETLGLLKTSPKHVFLLLRPSREALCG